MRWPLISRTSILLPVPALLAAFAAGPGCVGENRELLSIPVTAPPLDPDGAWTTADGVEITLSAATLVFADLRLEAPAQSASSLPALLNDLRQALRPVPVAHAHPGHNFSGNVSGELLGRWSVSLLGDAVPLGTSQCYEGSFATARLLLPGADAGAVAHFAGTATPAGGSPIPFDFEVSLNEEVLGIPFEVEIDAASPPGAIALSIDAAHMLSFVSWSTPDGDLDGLLTLADGALGNTVPFGVRSTPAFRLELVP